MILNRYGMNRQQTMKTEIACRKWTSKSERNKLSIQLGRQRETESRHWTSQYWPLPFRLPWLRPLLQQVFYPCPEPTIRLVRKIGLSSVQHRKTKVEYGGMMWKCHFYHLSSVSRISVARPLLWLFALSWSHGSIGNACCVLLWIPAVLSDKSSEIFPTLASFLPFSPFSPSIVFWCLCETRDFIS